MKGSPRDLFTGESLDAGDAARLRGAEVRDTQKARVLQALFEAYPGAISHAEICTHIGSNRASHRIKELVDEGWKIVGAGVLGLDEGNQTQLYRLSTLDRGRSYRKHVGMKVVWDDDGLRVSLHRDINGEIDRTSLEVLARRIKRLVEAELGPRLGAALQGAEDALGEE
jgi:hypothetical protein